MARFDRRRAAVVQERAAVAKPPQRGRADLRAGRGRLIDAVAGADVVQQEIGEELHGLAIEERVVAAAGRERGNVTRGAADLGEDALARPRLIVNGAARRRHRGTS